MNPFTENKTALWKKKKKKKKQRKEKEKIKRQTCLVRTTKNYLLPSK